MKTEVNYLVVFDKVKLQYSSVEKIKKLIGMIDGFAISENQVSFNGSNFSLIINEEKIEIEKYEKMMLIDLTISSRSNENDIDNFSRLLREIRMFVSNNNGSLVPVFDGISAFYAEKAYPYVHLIENLMRQLFAKFLLIKLGPSWADSIPSEITSRGNGKESNPLYELDFIQINDLLFKEYAAKEADSEFLKGLKENGKVDNTIEEYIPQSNWVRYFQPLVNCEASYIQKRWEKLYSLRNKIAHNKLFTKEDFNEVKKVTDEVKSKLIPAIDKISKIVIKSTITPEKVTADAINVNSIKTIENLPKEIAAPRNSDDWSGALLLGGLFGAFIAAAASNK
ncbi:MAG: HEPN domain-containing protein [Pseudoalteromonas sp.]|uniref:HEPN domain-containing protein n=1 Tax=Pseudoalteromonas sp. TaxID=53249 RepID=UPI0025FF6518|nr:HEPN domain-containing protein [Pseudoalteromonas sp.]MCH2089119.1 HEPN domain-containing protein [Pseudoalteromonas sp.]